MEMVSSISFCDSFQRIQTVDYSCSWLEYCIDDDDSIKFLDAGVIIFFSFGFDSWFPSRAASSLEVRTLAI